MPRFTDASLERLRALMAQRPAIALDAPEYRRAAVLVPLVRDGDGWSILFSRRADNLAAHSGQIAFPGGAVEAGETLELAAVRETEEEVGIARDRVELIGRLDDIITNSGFLVAPFVGTIATRIEYILSESEVAEVFEVPIDALLAIDQPEVRYVPFRDKRFPAYFYRYDRYEIWGLTGRMLKAFLDLVWLTV
ncbi:MAG TPA: CoA pyrophosphatase [Thermoanaerobaculia bacterium]